MKNYVLVHPWRVVPIDDVLMFLKILQQLPPVMAEEQDVPMDSQMVN